MPGQDQVWGSERERGRQRKCCMSWDVGNLWSSGRDGMGRKDSDNQEKNLTTCLSISVQNTRSTGNIETIHLLEYRVKSA